MLVEAAYNANMPFKWNATRIQVLPNQNPNSGPGGQGRPLPTPAPSVTTTSTLNAHAFANTAQPPPVKTSLFDTFEQDIIRYFFSRCKCPILHPLGIPSLEMRLLSAEDPQPIQVQATRIHQVSITDMILQFMNNNIYLCITLIVECPFTKKEGLSLFLYMTCFP